jgi:hypothetical protein
MTDLDRENCTIGLDPLEDVVVITIPIRKYALDPNDGSALIYGKMRELQAHVMQMANEIRRKKAQAGLMKVNGQLPPNLKVN